MKINNYFNMLKVPKTRVALLNRIGLFRFMSDEQFLKYYYKRAFGRELNIDSPEAFTEKLQWLKLYNKRKNEALLSKIVDKNSAKDYVAEHIGKQYIIPTLGVYNHFDDIDFSTLPSQFVLKCNHDSGGLVVCKDKSKLNIEKSRRKITKCLKYNYYWDGREWPYKSIKPCIMVEQYMEDKNQAELRDYKFFCFNGKVKCFKVDFNRFERHQANYYNTDCEILPFGEASFQPDYDKKIEFPHNISKMMKLAEDLAEGFPFVRVDFYNVDGNIYFGEMTFCPASGFGVFTSDEWDYKLGSWLNLPKE